MRNGAEDGGMLGVGRRLQVISMRNEAKNIELTDCVTKT